MKTAAALSVALAALAAYGWLELGAVMLPDFELYTQGGLGLFPSPLGRALGALGPDVFAWFSVAGAGVTVAGAAMMASRSGGSPALGALAVTPAALYLGYAGVDPIALGLLLVGLAGSHRWLVGVAAGLHLSLVPFALLELGRRSTWPARYALAFVLLCATIALALTPYQPVLWLWMDWNAVPAAAVGLLVGVGLSLPGLLLTRPSKLWLFALLVGALECALQVHVQARYLLPAVVLSGIGPARGYLRALSLRGRRLFRPRRAASVFASPVTELLKVETPPTSVLPHHHSYAMAKKTKRPLDTAAPKLAPTRLTRADAHYRP